MNTQSIHTRTRTWVMHRGFPDKWTHTNGPQRLPVGEVRFSSLALHCDCSQAIGMGVRVGERSPHKGCLCIGTKRIRGSGGRLGSRTPLPPSGGIKQQKCSLLSSSGGWLPEPVILEGLRGSLGFQLALPPGPQPCPLNGIRSPLPP